MPIPGSILNTIFDPSCAKQMYESVANLWPLVKSTDSTGQEIHTFAQSTDPAQLNLACRKSPLIIVRPQDQEQVGSGGIQRTIANFQLNFMGYINVAVDQLVQWQVNVDGTQYQIRSVEPDGSSLTTRMKVDIVVPFNA